MLVVLVVFFSPHCIDSSMRVAALRAVASSGTRGEGGGGGRGGSRWLTILLFLNTIFADAETLSRKKLIQSQKICSIAAEGQQTHGGRAARSAGRLAAGGSLHASVTAQGRRGESHPRRRPTGSASCSARSGTGVRRPSWPPIAKRVLRYGATVLLSVQWPSAGTPVSSPL